MEPYETIVDSCFVYDQTHKYVVGTKTNLTRAIVLLCRQTRKNLSDITPMNKINFIQLWSRRSKASENVDSSQNYDDSSVSFDFFFFSRSALKTKKISKFEKKCFKSHISPAVACPEMSKGSRNGSEYATRTLCNMFYLIYTLSWRFHPEMYFREFG